MEGHVVISPHLTRTSDKIDPKTGVIVSRVVREPTGTVKKVEDMIENSREDGK
jgi:hypothetical protein